MEIIGLTLSLLSLLLSLFIFTYFKKLRNNRTRIHKNLFAAMVLQVLVRLILYADQAIVRGDSTGLGSSLSSERQGIDNMPVLCEGFYILLEYGRSSMFMWMFIEGMYLNNLISVAFFQGPANYNAYYAIGW
ncbi:Hormone receptor domain, partial [Halocaridina rubra]